MAILSADIEFRLSGGSGNSDPALSLGGAKSSTSATGSTLFDVVTGAESDSGDTEYRCIYIHNADPALTMYDTKVWLSAESAAYHAIALGGEGLNGTAETVADENTAPSGESFSSPASEGAALSMGDIPSGQHYPIWLRRTIPGSTAAADVTFTLRVKCDTED